MIWLLLLVSALQQEAHVSFPLVCRTKVTRALYEVVVDGVRQECVYGEQLTEFTASLKTELATIVDNHGAPLQVSRATLEDTAAAVTLFKVDFNEQISGDDLEDVLERLCDARDKEFPGNVNFICSSYSSYKCRTW